MRLYIAGPMRGYPHFNFPAFDAMEAQLVDMGHQPFNPAWRDREVDGFDPVALSGWEDLSGLGFSLRNALGADLEWICRHAEGIVVLDGWERSKGATAEVAVARALSIPVLRLVQPAVGKHMLVEVSG